VDRRREIRDFLVSRRARITPEQAGIDLPGGGRRRVPGLRRSEVAALASISVDYYVQLERGDLDGASDAVLAALARALQLDDAERAHLLGLARTGTDPDPPTTALRPHVQRVLETFAGVALVRNRRWDYLGANHLGRALYAPIFDAPREPPNHLRFLFLDAAARTFAPDWEDTARDAVRILRAEASAAPHDPGPAALIEELRQASEAFAAIWDEQDVRLPAAGRHRFLHPEVGPLELTFEAATLRADHGLTLLLATAEPGSATADALRRLADRPPAPFTNTDVR
jgi:transcriptional regulator with XRE-family HTH domain